MSQYLFYFAPVLLVAVVVVLVMGLASFASDSAVARARSNRLMQWRIGLQLAAVALIVLTVALLQIGL